MKIPALDYPRRDSLGFFCPRTTCPEDGTSPGFKQIVRYGSFYRSSDGNQVSRYRCQRCRRTFSSATFHPAFGQKKRQINLLLWRLMAVSVNLNNLARTLGVDRKTILRKSKFLGQEAKYDHHQFLTERTQNSPFKAVQFDEMETFEHTKLKPLSIPLIVSSERYILGFGVASMPAKGPLAERSRRKYGPRPNERMKTLKRVLRQVQPFVASDARFKSDSQPHYPRVLKKVFPNSMHAQVPSRRAAHTGQGELKVGGFDPIFALNHTAAMYRGGVSRLGRRTWNTTKKRERLLDHLYIYASIHNRRIWEQIQKKARKDRKQEAP